MLTCVRRQALRGRQAGSAKLLRRLGINHRCQQQASAREVRRNHQQETRRRRRLTVCEQLAQVVIAVARAVNEPGQVLARTVSEPERPLPLSHRRAAEKTDPILGSVQCMSGPNARHSVASSHAPELGEDRFGRLVAQVDAVRFDHQQQVIVERWALLRRLRLLRLLLRGFGFSGRWRRR